jgi:hypothetical protein
VTPWSASTQNHARVQTVMRRRVRDYRPLMAKGGERGANDLWQDFISPQVVADSSNPFMASISARSASERSPGSHNALSDAASR